ncbi:MAG: entericidin A/B family lipoprotein [Phycisphaeraceae bacterium]
MLKSLTALVLCAALFFAAGCNTVKGLGKDVQAAGEGLQDVAD